MPKWVPSYNEGRDRWRVILPAKWSDGVRKDLYFKTKSAAEQFIRTTVEEREQHGASAITPEERQWVQVLRSELGDDLDQLRDILSAWRRTKRINPIPANTAVEKFLEFRFRDKLKAGTRHDISWRLRAFADRYGTTPLHEIGPGELEAWLQQYSEGWSRRSIWKRIRPFYDWAKRNRMVVEVPLEELRAPDTGRVDRQVYTPDQFQRMADTAFIMHEPDVFFFVVLSGLAFFRSQELVRRTGNEPVLEWSSFLWDRKTELGAGLIHVPETVAKSTRRKSSDERYCPIHPRLLAMLEAFEARERSGRCVTCSVRHFRQKLHRVHAQADVPLIDNGWRKSALSYWLAAHPEYGVAQISQWAGNSEASARAFYISILTKEMGEEWFKVAEWYEPS